MKRHYTFLMAAFMLLALFTIPIGMRGQTTTLVSGSGTSDYTIPDGWTSSGTVEGGSYLKFDEGTITSPEFAPHNGLSFYYSVATFGSGTNHPLTIRILNASTDAVIVETTTATPTSSTYINTGSPLSLGDVTVAFKIQMYGPTGKGVRLRNYSVTGTPAGDQQLTPSDFALVNAPVELEFDLYDNANAQTISYTTSSTGAVTVSQSDYITATVNANNTITVTPVAVTNGPQTITVTQAADNTYATGSVTFTVDIEDTTPFTGGDVTFLAGTDLGSTSSNNSPDEMEKNDVTVYSTDAAFATAQYRLYQNSVTTISVGSGTITNIVFNGQSTSYPVSRLSANNNGSYTVSNNVGTWTGNSNEVSFDANGQVRLSSIVVTVDLSGAAAPSITADNVNLPYNATYGLIEGVIENYVEGTITASTDADWISDFTYDPGEEFEIGFTTTANSTAAARSATVTLTFTYNTSETATANVTVTQEGNPNIVDNISDITATNTNYAVRGTIVAMSTRGLVFGDGTGYVYYYNTSLDQTAYNIGDIKKISGTMGSYNHVFQFTNSATIEAADDSNYDNTPAVQILDASGITAYNDGLHLSDYVQIEGKLVKSGNYYNLQVENLSNDASIAYPTTSQSEALNALLNKTVIVKGYFAGVSSSHFNVVLESIEEVVADVEAPTFSPEAGTYASAQTVTISCATAGVDIFYTLDGSEPDDESNPYSSAITVSETTTIKAIAYAEDDVASAVTTATYHICSQDNPYTVTQALNFAEYQYPANNVYVHGIVSTAPTSLSSGTLTYYISVDGTATNELEVYKGKGLNNEAFTAADDIQVGDIVTIYGNVQVYNSTIEFGSGNYLVEFERPTTPAQEYTLTISDLVNVNTYVFAGDESEMLFEGEGSEQILEGTEVMISVDVEEGYVLQSLMVDGTNHAADIDGGMYIFDMPDHDVTVTATAVENVAPADGDYVRISSLDQLTDGSKVIIAARHDEDHTNGYYAMPGQTTGRPTGVAFTSETSGNNEILPATITTSEDTYYWTVNVTENGYTFTNAENQMIGYTSSTNFATGGNNTEWTISIGTAAGSAMVGGYTGFVIRNGNTDTRAFAFNGTVFGAYATTNMSASGYNFFLDFFVQSNETPEESYTLTINGYGNNNAPSHYYLIASPVTVDLSNHELTTGDFDLYRFDQTQENEWQNYKQNNFNLEPGKGYLYANKIGGDFELSGTAYDGDGTVTLVKNDNAPRFPGWNLVGNPYGDVAYIVDGRDFYVMTDGNEIVTYDGNDIQPLQGIFVVAENDGETMAFTTTAPTNTGEKFVFNISQGRGDVIDRAMVRFGEGRTLPKFQLFETSTKLYIPQADDDYAVVYAATSGELPLNFRAAENGAYTLSFDNQAGEFALLHLIDNKTRADIDLLANPSYTFNAETTDDEDRFTLVYSKAGAQTLPYSYGFEDNNLATDGWTAQITSYSSGINSAAAHTGSLGFRFQYSENPGYLVSPLLTGGGTNGIELSFYYKEYSSSYGDENFQVGYTTDANETDPSNFRYGEIIEATTSWQQHTETLPAGTVRMAIKYLYVDAFYLYLDDFTFEVSNPCSKPTDLAVTTDGQTATVTWDGTAANNFIVTVNNGTPATGQTSPYTFNVDLSSTYEVTVMADCGAVGTSNPESISFSTPDCLGGHIISYALTDSYGDGWNGNAINVVDECGNLIETLTIASGSSNNGTLSLCGDYYQFTWTAGGYADETSFTLLDNGVAIYSNQSGSSLTDGQVLYTIGTNTRIPRPTALTAGTPGYDNVDLSWTENGTATAWEVCINGDESNLVPANTNVNFNLTGLQPDNSYSVKVRAVSGSYISCWSDEVTVTTPVACARPTGLTEANITFTTADLSWTGTANSYVAEYGIWAQAGTDQIATATLDPYTFDLSGFSGKGTVAIRHYNVTDMFYLNVDDIVVKDANGNVVYSEDFESGSIPANISNIDLDGDGYMWAMGTNGISGQSNITVNGHYGLYSASWYGGNALNPDNWLVISDITLGGSITFKAVGQDPSVPYENFAVYVIADNQFTEAYNGTRTSCQVTGLTEGTAYAWRVQGDCGDYASNWVFSMFKTPDNLLIFATEGNWDNPRNWTDTEGNTATTLPTADNKVRIDADATIPAGVVATAKNAVLNGGSIEIEEGGQLKQGGTVKVTMHKGIEGYGAGNEEDADHYYFIATPHSCSYLEESDLFPYVLNVTDGNYDLYAFDPTQELEWINFKSNSDHSEFHTGNNTGLFNKKGYLYANEEDTDLQYVGTVSSSLNNILTESFTYSETSTDDFNGWRLVGNPFTCDAYISYVDDNGDVLEADFYTLNDGKTYTLSESNVGLAPLAGALINYSATGKIQFASEEPTGGKRSGMLNMTLTQGRGKVDQARIRFGQGYNLDKISFRNNSSRLYIPQDNRDYAVVYAEAMGEMPVNFKAEKNGTYTLCFNNEEVSFTYLHLIDNLTGADVDLLANPSYSFDAKMTDYASRFKLVYTTGTTADSDNFGFISNNHLMILGLDGQATLKIMDVTGRTLIIETFSGSYDKALNLSSGVYMLQLIQGNNVKTQKIVVK